MVGSAGQFMLSKEEARDAANALLNIEISSSLANGRLAIVVLRLATGGEEEEKVGPES